MAEAESLEASVFPEAVTVEKPQKHRRKMFRKYMGYLECFHEEKSDVFRKNIRNFRKHV